MLHNCWALLLATLLLVVYVHASRVHFSEENGVKSAVYLSPKFVLGAGSVANKNFYNVDFPKGHIAIKEFTAEVVDENGISVPLHQTYLHHWLMQRYYGAEELQLIPVRNSGVCSDSLPQYFGLGSETRKTDTYVPDPYGIEVGDPADVPDGYDERWVITIHAINTQGTVDKSGCTECKCSVYNITTDELGRPLSPDYLGGLRCCGDNTQCRLKEGFESVERSLYLKYTVKWVDWMDSILPVRIYILDITDTGETAGPNNSVVSGCQIEYDILPCNISGAASKRCVDSKKAKIVIPKGGHVIYGVAHQHSGGIGSTLRGEDGRRICSSMAIYGKGKEAGNEAGYVVGMTTCYPRPGSIKISNGERLSLVSKYNNSQLHTGVMGLFYLLIADQLPNNTVHN